MGTATTTRAAVCVLAVFLALSCGGGGADTGNPTSPGSATPATPVATSISVSPATGSVDAGKTIQLTATAYAASGAVITSPTIAWSSSDASLAAVSASGVVTGIATGTVTITAASGSVSGSATLQVNTVIAVSLDRTVDSLLRGDQRTVAATARNASGGVVTGRPVSWSISDTTIASIDAQGVLRALRRGQATVSARIDAVTATMPVVVATDTPTVAVTQTPAATRTGWAALVPLVISVRDGFARPVAGATVAWSVPSSTGWLFATNPSTGADGTASALWVADTVNGTGVATVQYRGGSWAARAPLTVVVAPTTSYNAINTSLANPGSAAGYRISITPLSEPAGTYWAAIQWNGGYTGLQRTGTPGFDRIIQFSAWNTPAGNASVVDSATSHLKCYTFGNEGTGVACQVAYAWQVNGTYTFETQFTSQGGATLIDAWITDVASGSRMYIGRLQQAGTQTQSSLTTFVEDFVQNAPHCLANLPRGYRIASVQALIAGSWTVLHQVNVSRYPPTTTCANVNWQLDSLGLQIWLGTSTPRDPNEAIPNLVSLP